MKNLINPDNPIMRFLGLLFNLMHLNILFIICCIPIVTIGASTTAMYNVALKLVKHREPDITKTFFEAFKGSFKKSTIIWIPILLASIFFGADLYIIYFVLDRSYRIFQFPVWIFIFIIVSIIIYAFPILSTYESGTKQLLKNSILLSMGNFPTTVFIAFIYVVIFRFATSSGKNLIISFSILLFFGFAAIAYFNSLFLARIFKKCSMDGDDENEDDEYGENENDTE